MEGLGYAFLFRNYRPELAKWQTSAPLGYPDGWNNLAYVNNLVTSSIDWLGTWELVVDGTPCTGTIITNQNVDLQSPINKVTISLAITEVAGGYMIQALIEYQQYSTTRTTDLISTKINVSVNSSGEIDASLINYSRSYSYGATGSDTFGYSVSGDKKSISITGSITLNDLSGNTVSPPPVSLSLKVQE